MSDPDSATPWHCATCEAHGASWIGGNRHEDANPTHAVQNGRADETADDAELPHMPGCADPDHRPATSLCTTEPYRTGLPWTSA